MAILIPASPVAEFLSQIAAFNLALRRLNWRKWQPSLHILFGGEPDLKALEAWRPYIRDVNIAFVGTRTADPDLFFSAQIDGVFRWAPTDADVLMRMDADTLPVGDFEDVLDHVAETQCVAGVIAHYRFPAEVGINSREAWRRVADGLISAPLACDYHYSLASSEGPVDDRVTPFYVNDGVVFIAASIFKDIAKHYLTLRPAVAERLSDPYFSGQVALALSVVRVGANTSALPMRYNFANDEIAELRYHEELENVAIYHYLRLANFDRHRIFQTQAEYMNFLNLPLTGVDGTFQNHVRRLLGVNYPFASWPTTHPAIHRSPAGWGSAKGYDLATARHMTDIMPALAVLDEEMRCADSPQKTTVLNTRRTLLVSGLFEPEFYLEENPDVKSSGMDPLLHYAEYGDAEGRCPNSVFWTRYYRQQSMAGSEENALEHYILVGEAAGAKPSPVFDPAAYIDLNEISVENLARPLFHYLRIGRGVGFRTGSEAAFSRVADQSRASASPRVRDPLSPETYNSALFEHMASNAAALDHINAKIERGESGYGDYDALNMLKSQRLLLCAGLFDREFYLDTYPTLKRENVDPLEHYTKCGDRAGYHANPVFWPAYYRRLAMTNAGPEQNSLLHYVEEGEKDGRHPSILFDPRAYLRVNPALAAFVDKPLFHYLKIGRRAGLVARD